MSYNPQLKDFLSALASDSPTPGGGTASAVSGAMGISLLAMVLGVYVRKINDDYKVLVIKNKINELQEKSCELLEFSDLDKMAFDRVMDSFKLPKSNEEEKKARREKIQDALKGATLSPLNMMKKIYETYDIVDFVAKNSSDSTLSDFLTGLCLIEVGLSGAFYNVKINLRSITDKSFVESIENDSQNIYRKFMELLHLLKEASTKKLY
jgi:formiminotetrahydrofolate cyclodeaminase